jgi:hypothetical protein
MFSYPTLSSTTNKNIHVCPGYNLVISNVTICSSQWPPSVRRGSATARLLGLRVRIPAGTLIYVSCEYCVLSGRGLWVGLITRPEDSYQVWCVWVWPWSLDNGEALPTGAVGPRTKITILFFQSLKNLVLALERWCVCWAIRTGFHILIQWRYSPTGLWPTERPPPVSEASANFCG